MSGGLPNKDCCCNETVGGRFPTAQAETVEVVLDAPGATLAESQVVAGWLVVLMHLEQRWLKAERLLCGERRGVRLRIAGELAPLPM